MSDFSVHSDSLCSSELFTTAATAVRESQSKASLMQDEEELDYSHYSSRDDISSYRFK